MNPTPVGKSTVTELKYLAIYLLELYRHSGLTLLCDPRYVACLLGVFGSLASILCIVPTCRLVPPDLPTMAAVHGGLYHQERVETSQAC